MQDLTLGTLTLTTRHTAEVMSLAPDQVVRPLKLLHRDTTAVVGAEAVSKGADFSANRGKP